MSTISIVGCGWLGLPLGARLVADGHAVRGTTTTPEKQGALADAGITPFVVTLTPDGVGGDAEAFAADVLVLNVPPGRGRPDVAERYPAVVDAARRAAADAGVRHVLFASSTSVYPDVDRLVTEDDAGNAGRPSGDALLDAEALLREEDAFDVTILRYGGLYGYDRRPGRFLAGRSDVPRPEGVVNLIHRDDAVAVAAEVIRQEAWGEVFNAVAEAHPERRAFYTEMARRLGLAPPAFRDEPGGGKRVSNRRLRERLNYAFAHPDPMAEAP